MNSKQVLLIVGVLGLGCSPMAMAYDEDNTNSYFNTNRPLAARTVILESSQRSERGMSPVVVERTISSPVMIERTNTAPIVIEDRIIKQKHFFGIGIWPLFDFEIL